MWKKKKKKKISTNLLMWSVLKKVQRVLATYLHGNLVGACSSK